jgi:hypothetical protein
MPKGKEMVFVTLSRNVAHLIPHIQLLHHCQKFLDDPILLPALYMVQSNGSPEPFSHFMEILDNAEPRFSQEIIDDMVLLAREFGEGSLIASLVPHGDVPRHEENGHDLLQELDKSLRGTTIEAKFQSIRDAFASVQRRISVIKESFGMELEMILSNRKK